MIAVLAALPREVAGLVGEVRPDASHKRDGVFLYRLPRLLVVCAGMGSERVTLAVRTALDTGAISMLVSAGLAGGCDPALKVGSVVEARTVVDSLSGARHETKQGTATLVTTHTVAGVQEKQRLFEAYGAAMVDMEAATVARLADMHNLAFRAIKAVSDAHDFELSALSRFASPRGHFRTRAFALHTVLRPHTWRHAMQLGAGSQRALRNLTAALKEMTK